jgi:hypothetical protein
LAAPLLPDGRIQELGVRIVLPHRFLGDVATPLAYSNS